MDFDLPSMDVRSLSEEGVWMDVARPDGTPLVNSAGGNVRLRVLGPDSARFRGQRNDNYRARVRRAAAGQGEPSHDEQDAMEAAFSAGLIVGWSGVVDPETGEAIPFTAEAALALTTRYPMVRDQIDTFAQSRASFTRASSDASPKLDATASE